MADRHPAEPNLPWRPYGQIERRSYLEEQYPLWLRANRLRTSDIRRLRRETAGFGYRPLVSVLLPVGSGSELLGRALDSVLAQAYTLWELLVCVHIPIENSEEDGLDALLSRYESNDGRVKVLPVREDGEAGASNVALAQAAGEFVVVLGQEDELAPDALFEVVRLLQDHPGADLIYADSDELDAAGNRHSPDFKPKWSPESLLCTNYISRPAFYRRKVLEEVGNFREDFGRSWEYDLALRFTEKTGEVYHVPKVLYHAQPAADDAGDEEASRALSEALGRRGIAGSVGPGLIPNTFRVRPEIDGDPLVSVIIPTRDNVTLLENCVDSLESLTTHHNHELLIVDNDSSDPETLEYLSSTPHRVLRFREEFNYSRINNFAARHAGGEYLLFLNDDTEVISGGWMQAMLEHAGRPEVGAVGARLLYPDGLIQHAGVVLGAGGFWGPGVGSHSCQHYPLDVPGPAGFAANTTRNCGAVTAACLMLRKAVFEEIGGFDEALSVAFNDVDLCLRIWERGYRIVYTPHAELYHYESASRGFQRRPEENLLIRDRWSEELDHDPYYNPNFSQGAGDYNLRADMLSPRPLRADGPGEPREEMDPEERQRYLEARMKNIRDSRRTALIARDATPEPPVHHGDRPVREAAGPQRSRNTIRPAPPVKSSTRKPPVAEQMVWLFGSPRTGSTWLSGMMADLADQQRWNEPYVGLLFGSFFYEKIGPGNTLMGSPAFILGEPHREVWLNSVRNFVLEGAAARYPRFEENQYLVVKEPNGSVGAPLIMEALPESRLVFLVRDPRDVISSQLDASKSGSWNAANQNPETAKKLTARTKRLAERYLEVVSRVQSAYESHAGKKALVRYEDLRNNTLRTMRTMYEDLSISVEEANLKAAIEKHRWENVPEGNKGSGKFYRKATPGGWREDLSPEQIKIVEDTTAPVLSKFYPPDTETS